MKKATAASVEVQWLSKSSLNYFYIARFYIQRLAIVFFDISIPVVFYKLNPRYFHYRLSSLSNHWTVDLVQTWQQY